MRATTLKASSAGLSALVDYYAGLAADSSIGTALAVDRSTTTSTRPSRPAGGGARVVVPWGWPGMCSLVLMAALTGLSCHGPWRGRPRRMRIGACRTGQTSRDYGARSPFLA